MGTITERYFGGSTATTEPNLGIRFRSIGDGAYGTAVVRAIAKREFLALTTSTPIIKITRLDVDGVGLTARRLGTHSQEYCP